MNDEKKLVDARGLSCPQPILLTKKALQLFPEGVEILVDSNIAKGNIERFAKNSGYKVEVREDDETYRLFLRR